MTEEAPKKVYKKRGPKTKGISNNPKGRPVKPLTEQEQLMLLHLAAADCSKEGMRLYLKLSNNRFYRLLKEPEVQEALSKGHELKRTLIRMKQMEVAMEGNPQMLIHLGKNYLDQDKGDAKVVQEVNQYFDKETIKEMARIIANEEGSAN